MRKQHTLAKAMFAHLSVFFAGNGTKLRISAENRFGSTRLLARKCWESLFLYNRKLPQQKPFQGRMRSILVIAAAERRFFIENCRNRGGLPRRIYAVKTFHISKYRRKRKMNVAVQLLFLIIGFVMLVKGADWFVEGAGKVAERFGIPQLVIGLTIVAIGTSLPEAAVSTSAALKGSAEITIGNVVGSNIINILLILGITSVISPLAVQKSTIKYELPMVVAATVLLAALGLTDGTIGRIDGLILLVGMVVYLLYLLQMAKKGQAAAGGEETDQDGGKDSMFKLLLLILIGGAMIVFGSDITVDAATALAKIFGMSERLIGLTIVAFGTSLPELVTSAKAAVKGKADIAVGNIVGSNLFNILFVVGISGVITPVVYQPAFLIDTVICIATAVLLWICVIRKQKLQRHGGAILLACYAGYFFYLIR